MSLMERVRALENSHADQDIKDLARMVQAERSARCELSQSFEAFRVTNLQSYSRIQEDVDAMPEKMYRIARTAAEETSMRERTIDLEQNLSELKGVTTRLGADQVRQVEATRSLEEGVQQLSESIKGAQMVHQELSQIFETDRQTQIRATTELRGEIQCVMD